jgi:nitronate monooxygenase
MSIDDRVRLFCERFGICIPILLAPMAGACPPSLSIAVASAGGMGACGALTLAPDEILHWAAAVRASTPGPFQLNLWIPDTPPHRDREHERQIRAFLSGWGPEISETAGDAKLEDFAAQCDALLDAKPAAISSVMGLYPERFIARMKERRIPWFATVSTLDEAVQAETAGADVIIAQGMEAGGHRAAFDAEGAEFRLVGLMSLLPTVVDAVRIPVVASGGIADGRGVAAALALGASAVQIGTGFLRSPEAQIHPAWAEAIAATAPEQTIVTRAFSGRPGRSIANAFVRAAMSEDAPSPAPYPIQRALTANMRSAAQRVGDIERMQAWAGQSARLAQAKPAGLLALEIWEHAEVLIH